MNNERLAAPNDTKDPIHPNSSSVTANPSSSPSSRFWDIWDVQPRIVPVDSAAKDAKKFIQRTVDLI